MGQLRALGLQRAGAGSFLATLLSIALHAPAHGAGQSGWRAPEHTGLVVLRSNDMVVTVTDRGQSDPSGASNVRLIVEADTRVSGFASLSSVIDIDCKSDRVLLKQANRFSAPNLLGKREPMITKPTWLRPAPDAYLGRVVQSLCGRKPAPPGQIAQNPGPERPITTSSAARQGTAPQSAPMMRPAQSIATGAPAPASPPPSSAPLRATLPAPQNALPQTPPLQRPAQAGGPGTLRKPSPNQPLQAVKAVTAQGATQGGQKPGARPAAAVQNASGLSVQILASTDASEARRTLDKISKAQASRMSGLSARVISANIKGVTYHRARIVGFSSRASAEQFCQAVKATGQACFLPPS